MYMQNVSSHLLIALSSLIPNTSPTAVHNAHTNTQTSQPLKAYPHLSQLECHEGVNIVVLLTLNKRERATDVLV